jgi:RNA polymerase sigma-70 factor (ECF subfamily)
MEERLEAAFLAEIPWVHGPRLGAGLAAGIRTAVDRGQSAFPDLSVDDEAFARHLARALGRGSDAVLLEDLVFDDLYLACACAAGDARAVSMLLGRHGGTIRRAIERIAGKPNSEEIFQGVLSDLLVGTERSAPEIGAYAGRAPLGRWLEVVAYRAALRWSRSERAQAKVAGRAAIEPRLEVETPTELALFRQRYGVDFEEALKEALQRTTQKDRVILRLYIVNNISGEKIGKMLGVSQPTASRWLKKAREKILADLKAILKERLKISSGEIESLAVLLGSRLDLSISEILNLTDAS